MDPVDLVAIPYNDNYATFSDLRLGRSSQDTVGRLLRFWDARNIKKAGEFMGLILLFLDEKCSVIHAFIPAARADQFRVLLSEGAIFHLRDFDVARSTNLYKITEHPFVIRFLPGTTIVPLAEPTPTIEREKFMLRSHAHLQSLANTNLELPDVVGQIRFIQGSNLRDVTSTERVVVRFRIDLNATVTLSLWDEAAAAFRAHFASQDHINSVMLVTTINPKLFGGNLFLNSTPATRFFFDSNIQAIEQFTKRLEIESATPFNRADTSEGLKKQAIVSIGELNSYIAQPNPHVQEGDFLCKAQIVTVLGNHGWSYVSCAVCSRKLDRYGTTLRCSKCVCSTVTGVVRYRVELAVHDGRDAATFVVLDTAMTKLITKTASALTLEAADGAPENKVPTCVANLSGKQFVFQVRVTPFNFTAHHRTFTVTTITEDFPPEVVPQEEIVPTMNTVGQPLHVGPPPTTTSVDTPQTEPNSDVNVELRTRKRGRE